jgi:hypothetical protein
MMMKVLIEKNHAYSVPNGDASQNAHTISAQPTVCKEGTYAF